MVFDQINDEIYYLANDQSLTRKVKIGRDRVCRLITMKFKGEESLWYLIKSMDEIYYLANNQSLTRKVKMGRDRVCRLELR